jgi:hypothetical protein
MVLVTVVTLARASLGAAALGGFGARHASFTHASFPFARDSISGTVSPAPHDSWAWLREHGRLEEQGRAFDASWHGGAEHASESNGLFTSFGGVGQAQADEAPGTHPFGAEDELAVSELESEVGDAEHATSPGGRLPPSARWDKVPESNSLAHMRLLNELDGRLPSEALHSQTLHEAIPPSRQESARRVIQPLPVGEPPSDPFPQARALAEQYAWPEAKNHETEQLDLMTPFGAPAGCRQGYASEAAAAQFPPPLHLPASSWAGSGGEMECEGTLAAPEQRVVGHVRVADEELRPEQMLLRWEKRERGERRKKELPCQRVDANVRDFVTRARFAAGQGGNSSASAGFPGRVDAAAWQGVRRSGYDEAQGRGTKSEDDFACPGSPVSSMWSQDPCGYWVQEGLYGGEEASCDLDLGSWPEATAGPSQPGAPGASRFALRRDASSLDLWSVVDGEERDLSSHHFELEEMAAGYQGTARQDGMVGIGGTGDAAGQGQQWRDRFVPRPLQLEFARELRWFAWQGRESGRKAPEMVQPDSGESKLAGRASRRAKTSSRKQNVPQLLLPPFALPLPRSLSFGAVPTLPTSLRLRASATDPAEAGDDAEMEDADENVEEQGGEADAVLNAQGMCTNNQKLANTPRSRRGGCYANRKSPSDTSGSVSSAASCVERRASTSRVLSVPSISLASAPAHEHPWQATGASTSNPVGLQAPPTPCDLLCDMHNAGEAENERGLVESDRGLQKFECNRVVQSASSAGAARLDQVQIFKIREMLREMHRCFMSMPRPLLVRDGDSYGASRQGADNGPWGAHRELHTWRLVMYDAMMHAQSLVAAAGHATVNDGIAILDRMAAAGVPPTRHTYNKCLAVVAGAASHGHGNGTHAADVFVRMTQAGIEPDKETYWEWLSVLGSAIYHGQATMQEVYWALRDLNKRSACASTAGDSDSIMCKAPHDATNAQGALVHEDVKCLQLCLRAAVGGARRGLAGKADVEWVLRRMRSLQLEADHDTWVLAMQVLVNAALRGDASVVRMCLPCRTLG